MSRRLVGVGVWLLSGGLAWAQTVEFAQEVPIGKAWQSTVILNISVVGEEASKVRYVEWEKGIRRHRISEEGGTRWLSTELTSVVSKVNGQVTQHGMVEALLGHEVQYGYVGLQHLLAIRGIEPIAEQLKSANAEVAWKERLDRGYREIWAGVFEAVFGGVAGRRVAEGSSWEDAREVQVLRFPGIGKVPAKGRWTCLGQETPAPNSRAHLQYQYSDGASLLSLEGAQKIRGWFAERGLPDLATPQWSSVTMTNVGDLLIDPATLLGVHWTDRKQLLLSTNDPSPTMVRVDVGIEMTFQ